MSTDGAFERHRLEWPARIGTHALVAIAVVLSIVSWPSALAAGTEVVGVALDGVAPDDSAYPMTSPVGIGYLADRQAGVQPLIDWLLSEEGQAALGEFGVIPLQ